MDGKGGLGMRPEDAMKLTYPQAIYYLGDGDTKSKSISKEEALELQKAMSIADRERIKRKLNERIAYFNGVK